MTETYKEVVKCVADKVHRVSISDPAAFDVKSMCSEGLAKVCHVGAWAIRRVVASLLVEHLVGNYESLKDRTKYPETLCVTEDRQFRSRGLTHIEDWAYEFFLEAEVARVGLMNDYRLSQLRENLISESETHMKNDIHLQQKWLECFPEEEKEEKLELIKEAYKDVTGKYVMVGAGQYMRDYRRAHK
ncbi:unnamed protein product [Porites lobata]|uniref:Uncharacterized protein n=1 Tax=Porites lobata TaxID=104759 RepID=A0ABN8QXU1_9CNID|nr:unnamed protein product [Porites lobata]